MTTIEKIAMIIDPECFEQKYFNPTTGLHPGMTARRSAARSKASAVLDLLGLDEKDNVTPIEEKEPVT